MYKSKFLQVVLPVLVIMIGTFTILYKVRPEIYGDRDPEYDSIEKEYEGTELNGDTSDTEEYVKEIPQNYIAFDKEYFYDVAGYITLEEAKKITELTLSDVIHSEDFDYEDYEDSEEDSEEPSEVSPKMLSLTDLKYFPNLKTLTIAGMDVEGDAVGEEDIPSLYIDVESIKKVPSLQELNLNFIRIEDLTFLKNTKITALSFMNCDFSNIAKKQYPVFSQITSLTLGNGNLKLDLKKVFTYTSHLKNLDISRIDLEENHFFEYLKGVKDLESLNLAVQGSEPTPYEELLRRNTTLKSLVMTYPIADPKSNLYELTAIGELKKLEELRIHGDDTNDNITNYRPGIVFHDNEKLMVNEKEYVFDLNKENYHDYSYLKSLTRLKTLELNYLEITDISFISGLTALTYLDLSNNFIEDLTPMASLENLETLNLSFNGIGNIEVLRNLTELKTLVLVNNRITSIAPLKELKKLVSLSLASGYYEYNDPYYSAETIHNLLLDKETGDYDYSKFITSGYKAECLEDLTMEKQLYFEDSDSTTSSDWMVTLTEPFQVSGYMTFSKYRMDSPWGINSNAIDSIEEIAYLTNLKFLDLSGCEIKDLSSVANLKQLLYLGCMDNHIQDVSMITTENFPNLKYLYLSQNEFKEGENLEQFKNLSEPNLQCFLTPYYNEKQFGFVKKKTLPFSLEIMDFDVATLFCNALTVKEE